MGLCFSAFSKQPARDDSSSASAPVTRAPTLMGQHSILQAKPCLVEPKLQLPMCQTRDGTASTSTVAPSEGCDSVGFSNISMLSYRTEGEFSDCGLSLSMAASKGQYAAAHRAFLRLERLGGNPSKYIDEVTLECVDRIGRKFIEAMEMFMLKPGLSLTKRNTRLGLDWGMKLQCDGLSIVAVEDYDVDFVNMIAIQLQRDMGNMCFPDAATSQFHGNSAHESCWRRQVFDSLCNTWRDDIIMVSSCNVLDEILNGVCVMEYTLPAGASTDPFGTPLPAIAPGCARTPSLLTASVFTPLGKQGDISRGVRKCQCTKLKFSPEDATIIRSMSEASLIDNVQERLETASRLTREMMQSFRLEEAFGVRGRAEYLQTIREQIGAKMRPAGPILEAPNSCSTL